MNFHSKYIFKYLLFALTAWFFVPNFYSIILGYWASLSLPEFLEVQIQSGKLSYFDVDEMYFKPIRVLLVMASFTVIGIVHGCFFHYLLYPLLVAKTLYYVWLLSLMTGLQVISKPVENGLELENTLLWPINWISLNAELLAVILVPFLISIWVYKKRMARSKTSAH